MVIPYRQSRINYFKKGVNEIRIAFLSTYHNPLPPPYYGGEAYYYGIMHNLDKRGHEVHLFASPGSEKPQNGKLYYIHHTEQGMINISIEEWLEQKYHNILMEMDIIHDCSLSHVPAERLKNLHNKTNIINTINGATYYMPRPPFNVVTGSKFWQQDALKNNLKTEMIYWGVDTDFYTPSENNRDNYFLWLARFHPSKGLDIALDIAEYTGINLKVAGSMLYKDHKHYGEQYLQRIKQIPNVEYVSLPMDSTHHIAKRELYRNAVAYLYPANHDELFGLAVCEALACGCPVITSPKGAMPELVQDGYNGFLCEGKNDFYKAITERLPHCEDNKRHHPAFDIWKNARESSLNFTWERATDEYEKLYKRVLGGQIW